jgi:hypothetical protein
MMLKKFTKPMVTLLIGTAIASTTLVGTGSAQAATPGYTVVGNRIWPGTCLTIGQAIVSYDDASYPTPKTLLVMQGDGNLVDYPRNASNGLVGSAYWSSRTSGTGNRACFQTDGNFVIYSPKNVVQWNTHTNGVISDWVQTSPSTNDPSVFLSRAGSPDLLGAYGPWSSQSGSQGIFTTALDRGQTIYSADRRHSLNFQTDGNVVLRNASGAATWYTGTVGQPSRFFGQVDGQSMAAGEIGVFSGPNSLIWKATFAEGTAALGYASKFVLQNDGNLVLYSSTGVALWNSHTAGK